MSSLSTIAMDFNAPPGILHPFLEEKWSWVDQRLEELYYGYALTPDNCDEFQDAGLLSERWSWVDSELQTQYDNEFDDTLDEYILCPAGLSWVLYKNYDIQHCLEEEPRSRAESDISDYSEEVDRALKIVEFNTPLPKGMYPIHYAHLYATADEAEDLISLQDLDDFSTITYCSESSEMIFEIEDGYDSF
jgi:hypothetical protein